MLQHIRNVCVAYGEAVSFIEDMLRKQIVKAIGKIVTSKVITEITLVRCVHCAIFRILRDLRFAHMHKQHPHSIRSFESLSHCDLVRDLVR